MTERTIDILVRLNSKPADAKKLLDDFKALEKEAEKLQKILKGTLAMEGPNGAQSKRLKAELEAVNQKMKAINTEAKKHELEKNFAAAKARATELKDRMQKIGQVGKTLALTSAAILAPLALAVNKYKESLGETEPTSKRLVDLGERWEKTQVRLGRVIAEQVVPHLEKALDVVDKIVKFAEENPDFVKGALAVVGSIGILGTIMSGLSVIGTSLIALQSLTGIGLGTAATGAVTGAGAAGLTAGGIGAAVSTALTPVLVGAAALAVGAEIGRQLTNYILGTDTKWSEIFTTIGQLLVLSAWGWDNLFGWLGIETNLAGGLNQLLFENNKITQDTTTAVYYASEASIAATTDSTAMMIAAQSSGFQGMGGMIGDSSRAMNQVQTQTARATQSTITDEMRKNALEQNLALYNASQDSTGRITSNQDKNAATFVGAISGLVNVIPARAEGGPISGPALFMGGERGREFVMSNRTTKAAENIIGGTLTQQRLLQALSGGGKKVSYYDARRFDASVSANDRRIIRNETMLSLSEALG